MKILTWNLFHGRAVPPAGRALLDEFAAALAASDWDIALLQEVPPWWPPALAERTSSEVRSVCTSRNLLLPLRRWVAERWPDRIKSHGGGANAILVRSLGITEHRQQRLRWWPERRMAHAVRLSSGVLVVNVHGQAHSDRWATADLLASARAALAWARGAPIVLGGDVNLRRPALESFAHAGGHGVDHLFVRDLTVTGRARRIEHGALSDHAPVLVEITR